MSTIEQQVEAFEASVSDGAALGLLSGTPDGQVSIAGGQAAWVPIDVEPARSHTNSPNSVLQTARERSPYKPGGNSEPWPSDRSAARRCTGSDTSGIASCVEGDCHPTARNTIRLPVARSAVLAAAPPREQQRRTHASSRVRAADIGPEADRIRQLQAAIAGPAPSVSPRASWRRPSWLTCAYSALRARWGSHPAWQGWRRVASAGSSFCTSRWPALETRRRCLRLRTR